MRDRVNAAGRHEHLEAEQERSTDADLVDIGVLLGYRLPQLAISRPYDTDHDDENTEDFDSAPDDADEVIDRRFEALDRVLHLRASDDCSRRAAYHHDRLRQLFRSRARSCSLLPSRHGITGQLCPLLAQSRHVAVSSRMSAFGAKRTSRAAAPRWPWSRMTHSGQRGDRTSAVQRYPGASCVLSFGGSAGGRQRLA